MTSRFYFAWVNPGDTTFTQAHAREDERIYSLEVSHNEGDFPSATIDIRNPRVGLLGASRKIWAWVSWDGDENSSAGAEPLFFGRLVGAPAEMQNDIIRLTFVARPSDYDARKRVLAAAMRVQPYWDPIWIDPARRDDPDTALEARPVRWHIDRITHSVTTSDILSGEDGTLNLGTSEIIHESLTMNYGDVPLRRVSIEADVYWTQKADGSVDITKELIDAFQAVGTTYNHVVSSYTGQGLGDDWPEQGDDIGGGWSIGDVILKQADGIIVPRSYKSVTVRYEAVPEQIDEAANYQPVTIKFPLWAFLPELNVDYNAERQRSERVTFTLEADMQSLVTESSDDESETIAFSSNEVGELVDGEGSNATRPIIDLRRSQYFPTDRGLRSIEYLLAVARATIMARARTVRVGAEIPFSMATGLSCRMSCTITDPRLPGGTATGKITGYSFSIDGMTGSLVGSIQIGCTIGQGNTVVAALGTPDYVNDGYVDAGYQSRTGQTIMPIEGITYAVPTEVAQDDGVNFFDMTPASTIDSFVVRNGQTVQSSALNGSFLDISAAVEALNAVFTEVDLVMVPVSGGPFDLTYPIGVSGLMIPKTINLEAG